MTEYMKNYIKRLEKQHGKAFVEQLYQALKEEHSIYEAQLPPLPGVDIKPEHDPRSRMPEYYSKNIVQPKIEDTGFYGRQPKYGPDEPTR